MKVAIFLSLALLATLAHGSAVPKKSDVEAYKFVLGNINKAFIQLKKENSDCADCAVSLVDTISYCILHTDTTEGIIQCVKDVVGSLDACYPCICDVLSLFEVICPAKL